MISNLPDDLVEEILSRVSLKSTRAVRSTCKTWNALSKDRGFANKHIIRMNLTASGERELLMIMDFRAYLISVNLENNNVDHLSIKLKGKLTSLDRSYEVFTASHCNGSLLCSSPRNMDCSRLVIWNPYGGKPKWIKRRINYRTVTHRFALGYDNSYGSHKILRLFGDERINNYEIYHVNSGSWMVPSVTLECDMEYMQSCVSLKGNIYWYAKYIESEDYSYLLSFDFTRERFGPRLPLPLPCITESCVLLSVVREEKLAVLLHRDDTLEDDIWITNKIEPDAVSWSKFLKFGGRPSIFMANNFLIDEDKKVALLFYREWEEKTESVCIVAYIIGENSYIRRVDLG